MDMKVSEAILSKIDQFKERLTKCQFEILCEIVKGEPIKRIAETRFLSEKTIKFHLTKIYKELGVKGRTEFICNFEI